MSARRHVTNERALCNLTTSIRLLPDGRAVCFGAAGPKIVGAQLARILSGFSAPTSPHVLLRCGGAGGPFLSATGLDARRLGKASRALLQVYGRLRRQTASYLIEDAVRNQLVEPAAAPRVARPVVGWACQARAPSHVKSEPRTSCRFSVVRGDGFSPRPATTEYDSDVQLVFVALGSRLAVYPHGQLSNRPRDPYTSRSV